MKIYSGHKVLWQNEEHTDAYLEVEYKEVRNDGTVKCTGTEDFSAKRWASTPIRFVYIWDGERRNKGGKRWFEYVGAYKIDDPKGLKAYIQANTGAALVDVRTK